MPNTAPASSQKGLAEIDVELFTFVERYATNLIRWDLLLCFGRNPDQAWTAAETARKIKRAVYATTQELDDLTYLRVLTRRYTPERTTYQLTRRASTRRIVIRLANISTPSHTPSTR